MFSLQWKRGLLLLVLLFTVSCATDTGQPTAMPVCTPEAQDVNPYQNQTNSMANPIFSLAQTPVPGMELINKQTAQREAFALLVGGVRKWSDHVDLLVNGNLVVRITVTFVSPELVEGVILNQILYSGIPVADFTAAVQKGQEGIAKRNELLFLVTITASEYKEKLLPNDSLLIEIPVSEMMLTNSATLEVDPRHRDGHLAKRINLRSEPEHGYLAYPIAVQRDLVCQWVVDPDWNTILSLHVPRLHINGTDHGPQTWSIDYRPLIEFDSPVNVPNFLPSTPENGAKYSPDLDAPIVVNGMSRSDTTYWNGYWEGMARFIWYHLLDTIHH